MKKLKKITALLLALTATLSFATAAACGGKSPAASENPSSSQAPSSEGVTSSVEENSSAEEDSSSDEDSSVDEQPKMIWSEWEALKEPTCTEAGEKTRHKLSDATITENAPIAARGHDYSGENNLCIRCEAEITIPPLESGQTFTAVETCTHNDEQIYEGLCNCAYKGRGEEYSRLQLTEGCYTVETVSNGEVTNAIWISFSVQSAGQYMLYSIDNEGKVTAARYDASAHYVTPIPYNATVKEGDFYSYVSCSEKYFNEEWRATYCLKAVAGTAVKLCFVKIAEPIWERKSVYTMVYPQEINGQKAPNAPENTKAVEVDYDSEYYYSDPAFGGDGYYHLQATDEVIYAAIDSTPTRLLLTGKFTNVHYEGSALNLQNGFNADGDYNIRNYVPFIMNCADDNDIFNESLAPDLKKNCYQNFCNADGMYPVNQELFTFLNLYVKSTKPIDDAITVDDWKNQEDWLWLSACYVYKSIVAGTEENPLSLTLGENTVNIPLFDSLYCNLQADGVYTIKCDTEKVKIAIGKNTLLSAPFEVAVETSVSAPIEFTFSTADGKAASATVTVTQTAGVSNGLGGDETAPQPFAIDALGELTLSTVTVYGLNDSISYYAYYAFTATENATLCLTISEETTASVLFGNDYVTDGNARLEVTAGETVLIYVSNADAPANVKVELTYLG